MAFRSPARSAPNTIRARDCRFWCAYPIRASPRLYATPWSRGPILHQRCSSGPASKEIHGRSFLPIVEETNPAGWDEIYGSHSFHEVTMYYPMRALRTRKYKYILNLAHQLPFPTAEDLFNSPTWQNTLESDDLQY